MTEILSKNNLQRIRAIRHELGGNDAEALARMFIDLDIEDDGSLAGRVDAILRATEHHWFPRVHTFMDVPGLYEVRGASDQGFRAEFQDPWGCSRDQVGHFLTALGLVLHPESLQVRRLGCRLRDLAGVPKEMTDGDAVLRLIIGHEKRPDPFFGDPLILAKVRRQFASVTHEDLAAFRRAMDALGSGSVADLAAAEEELSSIDAGSGRGNSVQDLRLSLMGVYVAERIRESDFADGHQVAAWISRNLVSDGLNDQFEQSP